MDLEPGDVVFVDGKGLVDTLIKFGERKRYHGWLGALRNHDKATQLSHVALCVGNGHLVEALSAGLTYSPVEKYADQRVVIGRLASAKPGVTPAERDALVSFALEQLHRHYSYGWLSILSIVCQLLVPSRLDLAWDGALICSAFAGQAWEHAGVLLPTRSSLDILPSDLALLVGIKLTGGQAPPEVPPSPTT